MINSVFVLKTAFPPLRVYNSDLFKILLKYRNTLKTKNATDMMVKAISDAIKSLAAAIAVGGWIAVVIIVLIAAVAMKIYSGVDCSLTLNQKT